VFVRLYISLFALATVVSCQEPAKKDPFEDLPVPQPATEPSRAFFRDNFGFRKEIMSEFDTNQDGTPASRQSLGFEVLKKFSTATETVAAFDFQARLVRRDGFNPVMNDMEGETRAGWAFEYHNLYLDLYNLFHRQGRFNFRVGHFYVPFGLNLQTDTHGTVLQLSNERNFGFERDWYAGLFGPLNRHLNYDAYYLTGSGYDLKYKGQSGLGAFRLSLANRYSSEYGLEGGVSVLAGERLAANNETIRTRRAGIDGRYRKSIPTDLVTFTTELSAGSDTRRYVLTQLHQAEYLRASRRWGLATHYRRFRQHDFGTDASIIGEFTWYFRNDVGNSNLHWLKLDVERQLQQAQLRPATIVTLQYYFYR